MLNFRKILAVISLLLYYQNSFCQGSDKIVAFPRISENTKDSVLSNDGKRLVWIRNCLPFSSITGITSLYPISYTNGQISISQASANTSGYISSNDYNTFMSKEPQVLTGNISQYYRGDKTWQNLTKSSVGLSNVDNTSDSNKPISHAVNLALNTKQNSLIAGDGINIQSGVISSNISTDTSLASATGTYRLALTSDSLLRIVNDAGKVFSLQNRYESWALQSVVIDSTLSSYTIVADKTKNFVLVSTNDFLDPQLGKYKVYSSNLFYYLPKFIANYTVSINLPNPSLNNGMKVNITMNKRCTINFNYVIYYTIQNGIGGLSVDTDFGSSQMTPNLQAIPGTNFKASWFVTHDSTNYVFYVKNNKWYIQ